MTRTQKVKTGCTTCKLRRVKCDETKPSCMRCVRFGRRCEGYEPNASGPRAHSANKTDVLSRTTHMRANPDLKRLSAIMPQSIDTISVTSEQEARYFRIFQDQTSLELAGAFRLEFWDRLVLQASRDEKFIIHAIIALGALNLAYKSQPSRVRFGLRAKWLVPRDHYTFALEQYAKAVKHMRLSVCDTETDLWKALLSCMLVYCFEVFQGRWDLAISNAQTGHKLMQEKITIRARQKMLGAVYEIICPIEDDIIHAFARLDLLILTAHDTRSPSEHHSFEYEGCTLLSKLPFIFSTLKEAKIYLELLMRKIGHFLASEVDISPRKLNHPPHTQALSSSGASIYSYQGGLISSEYRSYHEDRMSDLQRWLDAFEPLVQKTGEGEKSDKWDAMARLQIHSRALKVLLASTSSASQMIYDEFLSDFKAIVAYASCIFHTESKMLQPCFNFDLSLLPPVAFVAFCCRDWKVRREALDLLKTSTPQREVFWNKDMLAAQATWIMEIEEDGLSFGEVIPEVNRVRTLSVIVNEERRSAEVIILRKRDEEDVILEKVIRW